MRNHKKGTITACVSLYTIEASFFWHSHYFLDCLLKMSFHFDLTRDLILSVSPLILQFNKHDKNLDDSTEIISF